AIRRRTYDRLSADSAASPGAVVDDEWLAEPLLQPLSHRACEDVARAAGGKSDDDAHRPRWIGLRPSNMRHGGQRGSGTVRPSALAVLRLMISSTLVICCTGRSVGFSPFRMRAV